MPILTKANKAKAKTDNLPHRKKPTRTFAHKIVGRMACVIWFVWAFVCAGFAPVCFCLLGLLSWEYFSVHKAYTFYWLLVIFADKFQLGRNCQIYLKCNVDEKSWYEKVLVKASREYPLHVDESIYAEAIFKLKYSSYFKFKTLFLASTHNIPSPCSFFVQVHEYSEMSDALWLDFYFIFASKAYYWRRYFTPKS